MMPGKKEESTQNTDKRTWLTSNKSLMIWSTSLPWKPTSVNLVASTFKNGACDNFAILLAISVLPQPVGPIYELKLKLKYK